MTFYFENIPEFRGKYVKAAETPVKLKFPAAKRNRAAKACQWLISGHGQKAGLR
jgi:hypothetical protein